MPVIRDAQDLSRRGPGQADQGPRARARAPTSSTPDEVRGGTFTITNPGGYGSIMATPVINLPQVGDPRHRGRRQAAGGGHRRARQRLDRDPPDDLPVHVAGTTARSTARSPRSSSPRCARSWRPGRSTRLASDGHPPGASETLPARAGRPVTAARPAHDARGLASSGLPAARRGCGDCEGDALREREVELAGELPDLMLLLEHPPVYTASGARLGDRRRCRTRSARDPGDALGIERRCARRAAAQLTYHGPGQLVG